MTLRDEAEAVIRGWHRYEVERGGAAVVDYDCQPPREPQPPAESRYAVLARLSSLREAADREGDTDLGESLGAHACYLRALLGERLALDDYVLATQGCHAHGWPLDYLDQVQQRAVERLAQIGIGWNENTEKALEEAEGRMSADAAPEAIEKAAARFEPLVRERCGTDAPYELSIETVDVDQYWSYWLDGQGSSAHLRLNLRRSSFTAVRARQFALHEILGHALQSASCAARCAAEEVPWLRVLAVHAPHQVLLEGLAQAMPLFITPDDDALVTRARLDHYRQLVFAELHRRINDGEPIEECVAFARARIPYLTDRDIGDLLTDRSTDPLLRSYLWAYPAGLDWFVNLADHASSVVIEEVLRAAYRAPLTPRQLSALWPTGPAIGGSGRQPLRVREPSVP